MARKASPWYWEARSGWYITKNYQHFSLGKHPEDAPPPRKHKGKWNAPPGIRNAFDKPMAQPPEAAPELPPAAGPAVAGIFKNVLNGVLFTVPPYKDHRDFIPCFLKSLSRPPGSSAIASHGFRRKVGTMFASSCG